MSVFGAVRDVWRQLKVGFWSFLGFDLFFKIVALTVLQPFVVWLFRTLVSSTGYSAVSNDRIISFLLSPLGVLSALVVAIGTNALLTTEITGHILINASLSKRRGTTAVEALWMSMRALPRIVVVSTLEILSYALVMAPFLAAAIFTYRKLLSGADINYFLAETPPRFWAALAIGGALALIAGVLVLVVFVGRSFTAHAVSLERLGGFAAIRRSVELVAGSRRRLTLILVLWTGLSILAAMLISVGFDLLGGLVIQRLAGAGLHIVLAGVALVIGLYVLTLAALTFVGVVFYALLVDRAYREAHAGLPGGPGAAAAGRRLRTLNRVAWASALFLLVASTAAAAVVATRGLRSTGAVLITAHRGSSGRAPENTLPALAAAVEDGADYAEIDVQETADGVIVLLHDEDLLRLAGVDWKIWEADYAALAELDVGSWFSPQFAGTRIPTLEEAIEQSRGRLKLNIELKYNGHDERLAERVVRILESKDFASDVVISSLNEAALEEVRVLNDQLQIGFIIFRSVGDFSGLDVDFFSLNASLATPELVDRLHRRGKGVHVWTINDRSGMSSFIDRGVENIITDHPQVLREMLEERAQLDDIELVLLAFRNWMRH